jgi:hypothetical protein
LREVFPVANCVVRNVSNCSSNKSKFASRSRCAFDEFLKDVQRIIGFLASYFSSFFVADFCFSILYFNSRPRVEAYERVLCKLLWTFDGFENVGCFIMLVEFGEDFER